MLKKLLALLLCHTCIAQSTLTILAPLDNENLDQALRPNFQTIPAPVRVFYAHGGSCLLTPLYACYKSRDPFIQIRRELEKYTNGQDYEIPDEVILQAIALSRKTNWTGANPATVLNDPHLALHSSHNDNDHSVTYSYRSGAEFKPSDCSRLTPNPLVITPL